MCMFRHRRQYHGGKPLHIVSWAQFRPLAHPLVVVGGPFVSEDGHESLHHFVGKGCGELGHPLKNARFGFQTLIDVSGSQLENLSLIHTKDCKNTVEAHAKTNDKSSFVIEVLGQLFRHIHTWYMTYKLTTPPINACRVGNQRIDTPPKIEITIATLMANNPNHNQYDHI